jgi:hypothetical protein
MSEGPVTNHDQQLRLESLRFAVTTKRLPTR